MSRTNIVLLFVLFLILGVIGAFVISQRTLVGQIRASLGGAKLGQGSSFGKVVLNIFVQLVNPTLIDANIEGYTLRAYLDGKPIADIVSDDHQYIPARSETTLKVVANINTGSALANLFSGGSISNILTDYSQVSVSVKGVINIVHRGIKINVPVDIVDNLGNLAGKSVNKS